MRTSNVLVVFISYGFATCMYSMLVLMVTRYACCGVFHNGGSTAAMEPIRPCAIQIYCVAYPSRAFWYVTQYLFLHHALDFRCRDFPLALLKVYVVWCRAGVACWCELRASPRRRAQLARLPHRGAFALIGRTNPRNHETPNTEFNRACRRSHE